ncbi:hypothetical protein Pelo_13007 [Pelomyxa schiedti]|nr:hypothetical protein Pelo_13007 [Pelomyxa schiedti]
MEAQLAAYLVDKLHTSHCPSNTTTTTLFDHKNTSSPPDKQQCHYTEKPPPSDTSHLPPSSPRSARSLKISARRIATHQPQIGPTFHDLQQSLEEFLRFTRALRVPREALVFACIYIDRSWERVEYTVDTIFHFALLSVLTASKMVMEDFGGSYTEFARVIGLTVPELKMLEVRFLARALHFECWVDAEYYMLFRADLNKAPESIDLHASSKRISQQQLALHPSAYALTMALLPLNDDDESQQSSATPPPSPGPTSSIIGTASTDEPTSPFPSSPENGHSVLSTFHESPPSPPPQRVFSPKHTYPTHSPSHPVEHIPQQSPPSSPLPKLPPKPTLNPTPYRHIDPQSMTTGAHHVSPVSPPKANVSKPIAVKQPATPGRPLHMWAQQQVTSSPPPLTLYRPRKDDNQTSQPRSLSSSTSSTDATPPSSKPSTAPRNGDCLCDSGFSSFASSCSNSSYSSTSSTDDFSPRPSVSDGSPQTLILFRSNSGVSLLPPNPPSAPQSPLAPLPDAPSLRPMLMRTIQANAASGTPPPLTLYDTSTAGQLSGSSFSSFASTSSSVSTSSSLSCSSHFSCEEGSPEITADKPPPDVDGISSESSESSSLSNPTTPKQARYGNKSSFQLPINPHRPESPLTNPSPQSPHYLTQHHPSTSVPTDWGQRPQLAKYPRTIPIHLNALPWDSSTPPGPSTPTTQFTSKQQDFPIRKLPP